MDIFTLLPAFRSFLFQCCQKMPGLKLDHGDCCKENAVLQGFASPHRLFIVDVSNESGHPEPSIAARDSHAWLGDGIIVPKNHHETVLHHVCLFVCCVSNLSFSCPRFVVCTRWQGFTRTRLACSLPQTQTTDSAILGATGMLAWLACTPAWFSLLRFSASDGASSELCL